MDILRKEYFTRRGRALVAFRTLTCFFRRDNLSFNLHIMPFDLMARQKAAILIMSARADGERVGLSRCLYLKFIG
jgi:hypothetical protein